MNGFIPVVVASDGDEGLKTAQERIPDLIISDMIMPRMNGNQLVEKLKIDTLTNHIPVIMLTAMTAQELKIKALTKGVEVYLTKPFDSNELLLQAQNLVELKENILKIDRLNKEVDELKDPFVEQLEAILEVHYENSEFGVPELIDQSNYSQMQLYRKLKSALQITPSQFIKEYRLKIGEELLRTSLKSVSEIAYEVGFSSLNYFSRSFAEKFECSPREYREKQVVK